MASIVQTSDFVGEYKVSQTRFTELALYITKYEKYYLLRMMGASLYDLFKADLTPTTPQIPQTARFENIFNPFNSIPTLAPSLYISEGIKQMLVEFIYFHYVRESGNYNTITGQVINNNENSTNIPYVGFNLIDVYNQGICNYNVIQEFIEADFDAYPEYQESQSEFLCFASGI